MVHSRKSTHRSRLPHAPLRLSATLLLGLAPLQAQGLYDFGNPNAEEQYYIELINRARANPAAEGERLATTTDPQLLSAYSQYSVDLALMRAEFNAIAPAPPLAPSAQLATAAQGHSEWMLANDIQSHNQTNPPSTSSQRIAAAGYSASASAENIFAFSKSVTHGHGGFQVDWGTGGTGGMQAGRGHRTNIHNPFYREIGIANLIGSNTSVGPQIVTQNFGRDLPGTCFGTGVAYYDLNGNDFYDPGEGIAGLTVDVDGSTMSCLTATGGGWALPVPSSAATRNVRFSGLDLDQTLTLSVPASSNAKADLKLTYSAPVISSSPQAIARIPHTVTFTAAGGATEYRFKQWSLRDAEEEPCESTANVTTDTTGGYPVTNQSVRHSGTSSFHLVNSTGNNQTIELNQLFFGGAAASLNFQSRLALSTNSENFKVQIQPQGISTWTDVDVQPGGGASASSFSLRSIDLSSMAGKLFRIRFLQEYNSGSYYTSTSDNVGWFIDSIRFDDMETTSNEASATVTSLSASFTPSSGTYLLCVTPIISGLEFPGGFQSLVATVSSNTKLAKLKLRGAKLKPAFKPGKRKYLAITKPSTSKVRINAATAFPYAKLKINGKRAKSGKTTTVKIGRKSPTLRILVIAHDGSRKTYRVEVQRSA